MEKAVPPWMSLEAGSDRLPGYLLPCFSQCGSMTAFLRSLGSDLNVSLLYQGMKDLDQDNAQFLKSCDQVRALTRQVILSVDGKPALFGQCMMDETTYAELPWVETLGESAIGERLFQDPNLMRDQIEVVCLPVSSFYHRILTPICDVADQRLWARRSYLRTDAIRVSVVDICLPWLSELLATTDVTV